MYVGVTIFALCGLVGVLVGFEATRFLPATGVGLLIAVASGTFLHSHKGLAGFALGSNLVANCSNESVHVGVTIFALCGPVGVLIGFKPPGSCQPLESDF